MSEDQQCPACGEMLGDVRYDECPGCGLGLRSAGPPRGSWAVPRVAELRPNEWIGGRAPGWVEREPGDSVFLPRCTYLGGSVQRVAEGRVYDLVVSTSDLRLHREGRSRARTQANAAWELKDVVGLNIGGEGLKVTDAGFVGFGNGIMGAMRGRAAANFLNSLTRKESITTILHIETVDAEAFLLNQDKTPEELRLILSPTLVRLRTNTANVESAALNPPPQAQPGLADQLERLAALHTAGALTDDEYAQAKHNILAI